LAEVGFDEVYGARPLRRAIQRHLQDPLALRLLAGEVKPGQTIVVDRSAEGITFSVQENVVASPA
jgi:ATP-dependent Clp protease ATP-binding subunit ClpA